MKVNFRIKQKNTLNIQDDTIHSVKHDQKTGLLGVGSSNGILRIANFNDNDPQVFSKSIHSLPVNSLDWLTSGTICMSVDSSEIILYDPLADKISHLPTKIDSNLRGLRSISAFEILAWYRNGTTILVDTRDKWLIQKFNKKQPVTCANINKRNPNIIYTTTVPGTVLNIWDKRYTSRGNFVCSSKQILNTHTTDFEYFNGSLILTDNLSNIFQISEASNFVCRLVKSHSQGRYGTICSNVKYDCLFIGGSNGVYAFTKSIEKIIDGEFLGCAGSSNELFVYSSNEIVEYTLIPYLSRELYN